MPESGPNLEPLDAPEAVTRRRRRTPPPTPHLPQMRWATSVLTSGVVYVLVVLADGRGGRKRWAEWLSHWRSAPESESAKSQHGRAFVAWLMVGTPLVLLYDALAWGTNRLFGAEPAPMISTVMMLTVLAFIALHGLLWALVPVRWPTRTDRLRAGWPLEVAAVAAVLWIALSDS